MHKRYTHCNRGHAKMIWTFKADLQGFELFIRQVNSGLDKLPISFLLCSLFLTQVCHITQWSRQTPHCLVNCLSFVRMRVPIKIILMHLPVLFLPGFTQTWDEKTDGLSKSRGSYCFTTYLLLPKRCLLLEAFPKQQSPESYMPGYFFSARPGARKEAAFSGICSCFKQAA